MSLRNSPTDPARRHLPKKQDVLVSEDISASIITLKTKIILQEKLLADITRWIWLEYLKVVIILGVLLLFNMVMIEGIFSLGEKWFGFSMESFILLLLIGIISTTSILLTGRITTTKKILADNEDLENKKRIRRAVQYDIRVLKKELEKEFQKVNNG